MGENATQTILVVGGGITGMTAAIEAAEVGFEVVLVEKSPYLGGRVAQFNQYFPKLCPPYCGLEINFKRIKNSKNIRFFTLAEVEKITGSEGDFTVSVKLNPRYVNENNAGVEDFSEAVQAEVDNPFNYGMNKIKAVYRPHDLAFPMKHMVDPAFAQSDEAKKLAGAFPGAGLDFDQQPQSLELKVGAIVWAAGWNPFDPSTVEYYNFGGCSNVITNVMMERLAAANGPTGGKILRPSDGKEIKSVAFVQCAGSRDENFQPWCSSICCMASLKQVTYVREQYPDAEAAVCFIDIRAMERLEDFYTKVKADPKVSFIKSKIARITQDPASGAVTLEGEDTVTSKAIKLTVDMAVLATGMTPSTKTDKIPIDADVQYDPYGFLAGDTGVPGLYGAGCVRRPNDVSSCVQSATSAALKAIQSVSVRSVSGR